MTSVGAMNSSKVEQLSQRLEELRRSFDDGIHCAPPGDTKQAVEYLLLTLSGEAYAYPVAHALEVLPVPTIIPVPRVPPSVLGIINFRGQILSVTTIHGLLGLGASEHGSDSRIIVTKGLPLVTGILADSVDKLVQVADESIQPLPVTIGDAKARLLAGQIRTEGRFVFVLDVAQLFAPESSHLSRTDPVHQKRY